MNKKIYIWDIEILDNLFTVTFLNRDSDEVRAFVITKDRDERESLFNFLDNEVLGLIGYNSIHFDAQIIEYMYRNPNFTLNELKNFAQLLINNNENENEEDNAYIKFPEWKMKHKHLDLFKALSLSTKAKRTSLKWCQYMLDMENVEDLPEKNENENEEEWINKVLSYNYNDVISTKILYKTFAHEIDLRREFSSKEQIYLMNSTEPEMAKKLFGKYLSQAMNISLQELKKMQTIRNVVYVKDIIFDYISFKTDTLNKILKEFKKLELKEEDKFQYETKIGDIIVKYGLGGIHGSYEKKIIMSDDNYIIKTADVKSYYPNLAIRNKLHPAHVPKDIFCTLYENIYNERISIPKSDPRNYILKILLNSVYGLSNEKYSFLKDRQFILAICINGQLCLSMLFEKLLINIPDSKLIMVNTDGFEILIPRKYEKIYYDTCKEWENITKFELEFENYQKLIIQDVNNYIALYENGKTKCKGLFEFENIPLNKNKSFNIIPIALYNYFIKNINIEDTIYNHQNIFDFCAGIKSNKSPVKGKSYFVLKWIENGKMMSKTLSKTVRYYISKKGKYLFKYYEDGSFCHIEAPSENKGFVKDWKVTYFNKAFHYDNMKNYDIDYTYYITKTKKIIDEIEKNNKPEKTLFDL